MTDKLEKNNTELWFTKGKPVENVSLRLFCFHHAGGSASWFREWQDNLPYGIEVIAIQYPGRENRIKEAPYLVMNELIEKLHSIIRDRIEVPYAFYGHSMGAKIAFEVIRKLIQSGFPQPECLFISGSASPEIDKGFDPIHLLDDEGFMEALSKVPSTPDAFKKDKSLLKSFLPVLRSDFTLFDSYNFTQGEMIDCPIWGFGGSEDEQAGTDDILKWSNHTNAEFNMKTFQGGHFFIKSEQTMLLGFLSGILRRVCMELNFRAA